MSDMPPIFVISLPESVKRRQSIENQLRRLNLDYQIIEAINGHDFDLNELDELYKGRISKPNPYNSQIMSHGVIGCLMSHIKFYNHIIEHNIKVACVLEDDAELLDTFPQVLQSIKTRRDWEVLLLGHYAMHHISREKGARPSIWKRHIVGKHYIANPIEFPFLTVGYVIKLSAAHKLREFAYPFRMPADWVTGNSEMAGAKLKVITPPVVLNNTITGEASYIQKISVRSDKNIKQPKPVPPQSTKHTHIANTTSGQINSGNYLKHQLVRLYWFFIRPVTEKVKLLKYKLNLYSKIMKIFRKSYIRPID